MAALIQSSLPPRCAIHVEDPSGKLWPLLEPELSARMPLRSVKLDALAPLHSLTSLPTTGKSLSGHHRTSDIWVRFSKVDTQARSSSDMLRDPVNWHLVPHLTIYLFQCASVDEYRTKWKPEIKKFVESFCPSSAAMQHPPSNAASISSPTSMPSSSSLLTKASSLSTLTSPLPSAPSSPSFLGAPSTPESAIKKGTKKESTKTKEKIQNSQPQAGGQLEEYLILFITSSSLQSKSRSSSFSWASWGSPSREKSATRILKQVNEDFGKDRVVRINVNIDAHARALSLEALTQNEIKDCEDKDIRASRKHRLLDLQHTLNLIRSSVLRSFLSRKLSFAAELGRLATAEAHSSRKDGQKLSFHSFALVQEGLAIAMQQVGLKEEALQLYDKLQLKLEETPHSLFLCDTNDAEETAFVERSKRKLEWEETGPPELSPSMQKKISTRTISLVRLQAQFESSLAFSPLFDMTSLNSRLLLQTKTGTKAYFSKYIAARQLSLLLQLRRPTQALRRGFKFLTFHWQQMIHNTAHYATNLARLPDKLFDFDFAGAWFLCAASDIVAICERTFHRKQESRRRKSAKAAKSALISSRAQKSKKGRANTVERSAVDWKMFNIEKSKIQQFALSICKGAASMTTSLPASNLFLSFSLPLPLFGRETFISMPQEIGKASNLENPGYKHFFADSDVYSASLPSTKPLLLAAEPRLDQRKNACESTNVFLPFKVLSVQAHHQSATSKRNSPDLGSPSPAKSTAQLFLSQSPLFISPLSKTPQVPYSSSSLLEAQSSLPAALQVALEHRHRGYYLRLSDFVTALCSVPKISLQNSAVAPKREQGTENCLSLLLACCDWAIQSMNTAERTRSVGALRFLKGRVLLAQNQLPSALSAFMQSLIALGKERVARSVGFYGAWKSLAHASLAHIALCQKELHLWVEFVETCLKLLALLRLDEHSDVSNSWRKPQQSETPLSVVSPSIVQHQLVAALEILLQEQSNRTSRPQQRGKLSRCGEKDVSAKAFGYVDWGQENRLLTKPAELLQNKQPTQGDGHFHFAACTKKETLLHCEKIACVSYPNSSQPSMRCVVMLTSHFPLPITVPRIELTMSKFSVTPKSNPLSSVRPPGLVLKQLTESTDAILGVDSDTLSDIMGISLSPSTQQPGAKSSSHKVICEGCNIRLFPGTNIVTLWERAVPNICEQSCSEKGESFQSQNVARQSSTLDAQQKALWFHGAIHLHPSPLHRHCDLCFNINRENIAQIFASKESLDGEFPRHQPNPIKLNCVTSQGQAIFVPKELSFKWGLVRLGGACPPSLFKSTSSHNAASVLASCSGHSQSPFLSMLQKIWDHGLSSRNALLRENSSAGNPTQLPTRLIKCWPPQDFFLSFSLPDLQERMRSCQDVVEMGPTTNVKVARQDESFASYSVKLKVGIGEALTGQVDKIIILLRGCGSVCLGKQSGIQVFVSKNKTYLPVPFRMYAGETPKLNAGENKLGPRICSDDDANFFPLSEIEARCLTRLAAGEKSEQKVVWVLEVSNLAQNSDVVCAVPLVSKRLPFSAMPSHGTLEATCVYQLQRTQKSDHHLTGAKSTFGAERLELKVSKSISDPLITPMSCSCKIYAVDDHQDQLKGAQSSTSISFILRARVVSVVSLDLFLSRPLLALPASLGGRRCIVTPLLCPKDLSLLPNHGFTFVFDVKAKSNAACFANESSHSFFFQLNARCRSGTPSTCRWRVSFPAELLPPQKKQLRATIDAN